jgi:drug/metabolite transporter (DMT)-like permease
VHAPSAALGSAAAWGIGDFAGGFATKRAPVLFVVMIAQGLGLAGALALALLLQEPLPSGSALLWAGAAGASGAVGLTALYASLAAGRMGVAAPLSGVVAASLPASYAWSTLGLPAPHRFLGMALALAGIALAAGPRRERPTPRVLWLALVSGLGFAGFLLLFGLAPDGSFLWMLVAARCASLLAVGIAAGVRRTVRGKPTGAIVVAAAGDTVGNGLFLLATRTGRLDVAVVLSALYPVATLAMARLVLRERLTRTQAAGAALMLVSVPLISAA